MPVANFAVTVQSHEHLADMALAETSKYLAYTDQTDLFGYHGKITDTKVVGKGRHNDPLVRFEFRAPVAQESDIRDFLDECETLARVENAECLTNPNL